MPFHKIISFFRKKFLKTNKVKINSSKDPALGGRITSFKNKSKWQKLKGQLGNLKNKIKTKFKRKAPLLKGRI